MWRCGGGGTLGEGGEGLLDRDVDLGEFMSKRPVWLTDTVIGTIDDKYILKAAVEILNVEGGGKRRRSSVFGI